MDYTVEDLGGHLLRGFGGLGWSGIWCGERGGGYQCSCRKVSVMLLGKWWAWWGTIEEGAVSGHGAWVEGSGCGEILGYEVQSQRVGMMSPSPNGYRLNNLGHETPRLSMETYLQSINHTYSINQRKPSHLPRCPPYHDSLTSSSPHPQQWPF